MNTSKIWTALAVLLLITIDCRASNTCEQEYQKILDSTVSNHDKILSFEGLRSGCSSQGRYYFLLAGIYRQSKNYEKSRDVYELGIKSTSDFAIQLKHGVATSYYEQNNFDKASELALKLIESNSEYVGGYALLADISLRKRDFQHAIEHAEHAVSIKPFAGGYSVLAASYYELNQYQKSLNAFWMGMKQENPQFIVRGDAIIAAAYAAAHLGNFGESAKIVRIRLAALPESEKTPSIQKLIKHLQQKGAWS